MYVINFRDLNSYNHYQYIGGSKRGGERSFFQNNLSKLKVGAPPARVGTPSYRNPGSAPAVVATSKHRWNLPSINILVLINDTIVTFFYEIISSYCVVSKSFVLSCKFRQVINWYREGSLNGGKGILR